MPFTKLDSGIHSSSVMEASISTRWIWVSFLAQADKNGHVDATRESLARLFRVSLKQFNAAVEILESPDPNSRSPEYDGRRLIRLDNHRDWGWLVVNHQKYKLSRSREERREYKTEKQREYRKKSSAGMVDATHPDVNGAEVIADSAIVDSSGQGVDSSGPSGPIQTQTQTQTQKADSRRGSGACRDGSQHSHTPGSTADSIAERSADSRSALQQKSAIDSSLKKSAMTAELITVGREVHPHSESQASMFKSFKAKITQEINQVIYAHQQQFNIHWEDRVGADHGLSIPEATKHTRQTIGRALKTHGFYVTRSAVCGILFDPFYTGELEKSDNIFRATILQALRTEENVEKFSQIYFERRMAQEAKDKL